MTTAGLPSTREGGPPQPAPGVAAPAGLSKDPASKTSTKDMRALFEEEFPDEKFLPSISSRGYSRHERNVNFAKAMQAHTHLNGHKFFQLCKAEGYKLLEYDDEDKKWSIVYCEVRAKKNFLARKKRLKKKVRTANEVEKRKKAKIDVPSGSVVEEERKAKDAALAEVETLRAKVEEKEAANIAMKEKIATLEGRLWASAARTDEAMAETAAARTNGAMAERAVLRVEAEEKEAALGEARVRIASLEEDLRAATEKAEASGNNESTAMVEDALVQNDSEPGEDTAENPKSRRTALLPAQTSALPFPVGCHVWYTSNEHMASGTVKAISIDISQRKLYYEISNTHAPGVTDFICEDDLLSFGTGCPVRVETKLAGQYLDGQVLHGSRVNESVTYTVLIFLDGKENRLFDMEEHVVQERLKYRGSKPKTLE